MSDRESAIARIMELQQRFQHMMASDRSNPFMELNLTMPQLKVLLILGSRAGLDASRGDVGERGGAGGQELVAVLGVTLASLTGIVDRLIAADLVTRREDPQDRRVRRIELTDAGRQIVDRLMTAGAEHQRRLLDRLSLDELAIIEQAMQIFLRANSELDR
jgi:DNA-binding MarR family transcriptional regulator